MTPADVRPRSVVTSAWLGLVLSGLALLLFLPPALSMLSPPGARDSMKATLLSASVSNALLAIYGITTLAAALGVGLGFGALRAQREQPSPRGRRVSLAAIVMGLLALVVALATWIR